MVNGCLFLKNSGEIRKKRTLEYTNVDAISSAGTCFREEGWEGGVRVQLYRGIIREVSKQKQIFKALCLERRGQVVWQLKGTQQPKTFISFLRWKFLSKNLLQCIFR